MKKYCLTFLFLTSFFFSVFSQRSYPVLYPIKQGWIKSDGKEIILSYADSTYYSTEGFGRFVSKGKFGFINSKGFEISKPQFDFLTPFSEGKAFAKKEFRWFAIDTNGKELFSVLANFVYAYSDGLARFQLGNKFGYVDLQGKVVITAQFAGAYDFNEGKARIYQNKKWGYIDKTGTFVIGTTFEYAWDFTNGLAPIMKTENGKEYWAYIDGKGKIIIPYFEGYAFPFEKNYALTRQGPYRSGKLFLIDKLGNVLTPLPFSDAYSCENGLINVCKQQNGITKWGYINEKGDVIIDFIYDNPSAFINGLAFVQLQSKRTYINQQGETIWKEL